MRDKYFSIEELSYILNLSVAVLRSHLKEIKAPFIKIPGYGKFLFYAVSDFDMIKEKIEVLRTVDKSEKYIYGIDDIATMFDMKVPKFKIYISDVLNELKPIKVGLKYFYSEDDLNIIKEHLAPLKVFVRWEIKKQFDGSLILTEKDCNECPEVVSVTTKEEILKKITKEI